MTVLSLPSRTILQLKYQSQSLINNYEVTKLIIQCRTVVTLLSIGDKLRGCDNFWHHSDHFMGCWLIDWYSFIEHNRQNAIVIQIYSVNMLIDAREQHSLNKVTALALAYVSSQAILQSFTSKFRESSFYRRPIIFPSIPSHWTLRSLKLIIHRQLLYIPI